jgi:hypothetical protein
LRAIRKCYKSQGLTNAAVDIIMKSWRAGTKPQYFVYLKPWLHFCKNVPTPTVYHVLEFLSTLVAQRCSYRQICSARSAISTVVHLDNGLTLGKHPLVQRFMKGVFESQPVFPKFPITWDVTQVLNFFRSLESPALMQPALLGKKLALLIGILAGGQRCQTLHAINVLDIVIADSKCIIPIYGPLKQSKPGNHLKPLQFTVYTPEPKLCVVTNLTAYLQKTSHCRQDPSLFISCQKPYRAVTRDTISRWCKQMMAAAGIDTNKFCTHSSRSAASSSAHTKGVSLNLICRSAGWSSEKTFARHYHKTIIDLNIGELLLQ